MTEIILIEPFYGGSHKQLIDLLVREIPKCVMHTLPAKKWHWRARVSSLYFSQAIPPSHKYRTLWASSVLNLAELVALRPDLTCLQKILYFHENQLVYPVQKQQDRDFQYGYNQILSCLVADTVVFNSNYNMESFLENINPFLKQIPDYHPKDVDNQIRSKCQVIYFPLHFFSSACGYSCSESDDNDNENYERVDYQDQLFSSEKEASDDEDRTRTDKEGNRYLVEKNLEIEKEVNKFSSDSEGVHSKIICREFCIRKGGERPQGENIGCHHGRNLSYGGVSGGLHSSLEHGVVIKSFGKLRDHQCLDDSTAVQHRAEVLRKKTAVQRDCKLETDTEKKEMESLTKILDGFRDDKDVEISYGLCNKDDTAPSASACDEGDSVVGMDSSVSQQKPLHIVWPHRWEHDKDPEAFFQILFELHQAGLEFHLSVLGQTFTDVPVIFPKAYEKLRSHIINWGFTDTKEKYYSILRESDIVISTAKHEFFGIAMLEAVHFGCYPLCPNRLVYPEIFPACYLYNSNKKLLKRLGDYCRKPHLIRLHQLTVDSGKFLWNKLKPKYQQLLQTTTTG